MKKKKVILIVIITLVLLLSIGIISVYLFINSKGLKVKVKNNIKVNINDKIYNTDYLTIIKNGKIITKKEIVDTSKPGKKKVTVEVKDYFKKIKKYTINIEVIDKEPPTIKFNDKLTTEEGTEIDLLKDVTAEDNSKEEIKVEVKGDYDFNKTATYELEYVAKDSSGNEKKEKFTLEVTEKKVVVKSTSNGSYTLTDKTFKTSNGHTGTIKNGICYIDGILIANKTYPLPSSYNPGGLTQEFMNNFNNMKSAANNEGVDFDIFSGFRSYNTQKSTYQGWVNKDGQAAADTYSARAGHSEHQSGLAADINGYGARFDESKATEWMAKNSYKYGFILRYPQGKQGITGYVYESWHFRYVGVDLATKLYNGGNWITLEEYFGITSEYSY